MRCHLCTIGFKLSLPGASSAVVLQRDSRRHQRPHNIYIIQGCHCQLAVKFKDFSRTFSNKFKDLRYQIKRTILKSFIILYINSAMSSTRFASLENRASVFVFKHCYIEGIMSRCDKQLILIIFCSKR